MKKEPSLLVNNIRKSISYGRFDPDLHVVPPGMQIYTYSMRKLKHFLGRDFICVNRIVCFSRHDFMYLIDLWNSLGTDKYIYKEV